MSLPSVSCPNCGYDATLLEPCLYIAPSPFQHLFDSHTSRKEISAARAQLKIFTDAVRGELHDLEGRIARLRQTLQEAEQHHAEAKSVLNVHVILNPPIESLPNEILAYIFSLTFGKPLDVFDTRPRMPWRLGQVCRHWTMLALQTPALWNSFEGQDSSETHYGPRLEEVLKRSGNSALYVSLGGLTRSRACILAQHASRLSKLELKCSFETLSVFKASPEMSILTKLCLTVNFIDYALPKQVYFDIATKAPRLTHIDLNLDLVSIDIPRVFLLPWPQITHLKLELGNHNYHHIFHILSRCRNLVSFTGSYRVLDQSLLQTPSSSIYVFQHLTFLDIRSPFAVLPCMQCPALQSFTLRGALWGGVELTDPDWRDFLAFVDRSHCTLQEVTFIPVYFRGSSGELPAPVRELFSFVSHVAKVEIRPPSSFRIR